MLAAKFLIGCSFLAVYSCQKSLKIDNEYAKELTMQQEVLSQEGSEVFLLFASGQTIPAGKNPPHGFYVRGEIRQGKFIPLSEVLGPGELSTEKDGNYGWYELTDRKFYEMQSGRQAQIPFVKGYFSKKNGFVPSVRTVFQAP